MLIAEQLVLLSLSPDGRPARGGNGQQLDLAVAAALVTELAAADAVALDRRLSVVRQQAFDHPLLARAMRVAVEVDGRKLTGALPTIAKRAGRAAVVDHLVAAGVLGRVKPSWWQPTRHPVLDQAAHADVLTRTRRAATSDGPLDLATATLLALSGPCQLLEVVAPLRDDRREARRRIKEATERVPAAGAAKKAIDAAQAAVVAATAAASTAASSSNN